MPTYEPRYAAIVMDAASGEILYQKRADSPRYPASITKIMTLYLTFEALSTGQLHETDMITVSPRAAGQSPDQARPARRRHNRPSTMRCTPSR